MNIATGKGGHFFSRTENTVIIFHLVSIVKYNNNNNNNNNDNDNDNDNNNNNNDNDNDNDNNNYIICLSPYPLQNVEFE